MSRDDAHLLDLLKAVRLAIDFLGNAEKSDFLADPKTQSAVLHQLLVLGEAVKRLSPQFRDANPGIPWKLIAGARDKLIRFYDGVDIEEGSRILVSDLAELSRAIEPLTLLDPSKNS